MKVELEEADRVAVMNEFELKEADHELVGHMEVDNKADFHMELDHVVDHRLVDHKVVENGVDQ